MVVVVVALVVVVVVVVEESSSECADGGPVLRSCVPDMSSRLTVIMEGLPL